MPEERSVLGVDVGSHGVRCVCGPHMGAAAYAGPPPPARRDAREWIDALHAALAQIPADALARISAIGITGVRGAFVALDAGMQPLEPAVADFDAGSIPVSQALKARFGDALVRETGCPPFPLSGLPKLVRLMEKHVGRMALVMTPQDFVARELTGVPAMSAGAALRMGCLDSGGENYAGDVLKALGIPLDIVPPLVPIGGEMGKNISPLLPQGVPVIAVAGDGPCAWAGAGEGGHALVSLGTTTVCLLPADGGTRPEGDITLEINPFGGRLVEYGSGVGGAAIDWLAGLTGLQPAELELRSRMAAGSIPLANPRFLSAWGSPPGASFEKIGLDSGPAELAAALFDAIARDAVETIRVLSEKAVAPAQLVLTGGVARSRRAVEHIRAQTGIDTILAGDRELAALGAAAIARHFSGGKAS